MLCAACLQSMRHVACSVYCSGFSSNLDSAMLSACPFRPRCCPMCHTPSSHAPKRLVARPSSPHVLPSPFFCPTWSMLINRCHGAHASCTSHSLTCCTPVTPCRLSLRPLLGALLPAPRVFLPLKGLTFLGMRSHWADMIVAWISCRSCKSFALFAIHGVLFFSVYRKLT